MSVVPRIEMSGAELATFEFGSESLRFALEAEFFGSGAATVVPDVAAVANAATASVAGAAVVVNANGVARSEYVAAGSAAVFTSTLELRLAVFSAPGSATEEFLPGIVVPGTFAGAATSTAEFAYLDGPGWDLVSRSTVTFLANAQSNSRTTIVGQPEAVFVGLTYGNTRVAAAAVSMFAPTTNAVAQAQMDAPGEAVCIFGGYRAKLAVFDIATDAQVSAIAHAFANAVAASPGIATVVVPTSAFTRRYAVMSSIGAASASFPSNARAFASTTYAVTGVAVVEPYIDAVYNTMTAIVGHTDLKWVLGRPVLPSMPHAYDIVVRPAESRGAVRPFELRAAEWK